MDRVVTIVVLPQEEEKDATLFQRFSSALQEIYASLPLLVRVPIAAVERPFSPATILARALCGDSSPFFSILNVHAFFANFVKIGNVNHVEVIAACHPNVFELASKFREKHCYDNLHVVRLPFDKEVEDGNYDATEGLRRVQEIYTRLSEVCVDLQTAAGVMGGVSLKGHNLITPNRDALEMSGVSVEHLGRLKSASESAHVSEIVKSVQAVYRWRHVLGEPPDTYRSFGVRIVVAIPGVVRELASTKKWDTRSFGEYSSAVRQIIVSLTRQKEYMHMIDPRVFRVGYEMYMLRARELRLFTAGLSLLTVTNVCPMVRLPPRCANLWSELRDAENYDKRADKKASGRARALKASGYARRIGEKIRKLAPPKLMSLIEHAEGHVKVVSDAPFELVPMGGVPISMRKPMSRICATPGNVFMQQCLPRGKMMVGDEFFSSVLIIRSFERNDPLRRLVEQSVDAVGVSLSVRIVDVASVVEFIEVLNGAEEKIVIYDGHGKVDEDKVGYLRIGGERLVPWEVRREIRRIPPVFFLSACVTHSLDTSHASVANGVLSWGGASVIGTFGVLDGVRAAVTVGRFINWLEHSIVARIRAPSDNFFVSWADAFSRFQRQVYALDVLLAIANYSELGFDRSQVIEALYKAGVHIYESKDWVAELAQGIAAETGVGVDKVMSEWGKFAYFSDAVKYVHFGRPEDIILVRKTAKAG